MKKGFTLIELLAVIVILAIILLIVMPIVLKVISEVRKGAFEATARGLIKAVENQYMQNYIKGIPLATDYVFADWNQEEGDPLVFSGRGPKDGILRAYEDGDIEIAINDNNWCVTKDRNEKDINPAVPYDGECTLPSEVGNGGNGGNGGDDDGYQLPTPIFDEAEVDCFIDGDCEGITLPDYYAGTEGTWIPIADDIELYNIREDDVNTFGVGTEWEDDYLGGEDKNYIQVRNVDLVGHANWSPGDFYGRYEGAGFLISNLKMTARWLGLFGFVIEAEMRNITLLDSELIVTTDERAGGGSLAHWVEISLIENCVTVNPVITSGGTNERGAPYVGGLVGYLAGSILKSSHAINPYMEFSHDQGGWVQFGGLVGETSGEGGQIAEILNSSARNVFLKYSEDYMALGGLLGGTSEGQTKISGSYATGTIRGVGQLGGLIGWLGGGHNCDYIEISNNYAIVNIITAAPQVGGLIGYVSAYAQYYDYPFIFINNYAVVQVTTELMPDPDHEHIQGFIGWYEPEVVEEGRGLIEYSYYDSEVSGYSGAGLPTEKYGIPRTTSDMTYPYNSSNTYLNWDFDIIWGIDANINNGYPYLRK